MHYYQKIIQEIIEKKLTKEQISKRKITLSKLHNLKRIPTDIEILMHAPVDLIPKLTALQTKPTRSSSGVAPIALMTKPLPCMHGKCTFCPGGPDSFFGDVPQSYTGNEPSTMRGIRNNFDAFLIAMNRLEQYIVTGHSSEKVEAIVQGGTFCSFPEEYQEEFIRDMYHGLNTFSKLFYQNKKLNLLAFKKFFELPGNIHDKERQASIHKKLLEIKKPKTLEEEQLENETAQIRCIGLTLETKPDWGLLKHGNEMLALGATRVELGIQTTDEETLKATNRGHTLQHSIQSTQILKDLGFKINYHMMPGLPNSTRESDIETLKEIFQDQNYKPDMLKIYPCLVMPGTPLEVQYKKGEFTPITVEQAADIIVEAKRNIPNYVRIMRVQRDIPSTVVTAGAKKTNLRQYVEILQKERNVICNCIRCREPRNKEISNTIKMEVEEYEASNGKEFFISINDVTNNYILGFCRLRFPSEELRSEITKTTAIVRELHVNGFSTPLSEDGSIQHRGYGKQLMAKAEEIAKQHNKNKILVIAGVGVKQYYIQKLNYKKEGPYVSKKL